MTSQVLVDHCMELLAPLGPVRSRRMFGGWGLYSDGIFVALIAFDRLYLKADATTAGRFAAAGSQPFVHSGNKGKPVVLGYWTAPDEALDSPAAMRPWAQLALEAALRARARPAVKRAARKSASSPPSAATSAGKRRAKPP